MREERRDRLDLFSQTTRKLAHLKLSALQCEILRELLEGNRTSSELTDVIFHSIYQDTHFAAYHSRTVRAVKNLETRGFVSKKKLFGRDKPFGLTHHGAAKIASIVPEMEDPVIMPKKDFLLFGLTLFVGIVGTLTLERVLADLFWLLLGMTIIRSAQTFRRMV